MDGFREVRSDWGFRVVEPGGFSKSRGQRNHGTRTRVEGRVFRALAGIYLEARLDVKRDTLASMISRRLVSEGIEYHPRTIRRQILGVVESVAPELESMMLDMCLEDVFARDEDALRARLGDLATELGDIEGRAPYVAVERLDAPVRLWLYFNPAESKRSLADRLHYDLAPAVALTRESIQWKLAGNGHLVRKELLQQVLRYLEDHGVQTEQGVKDYLERDGELVQAVLDGRDFTAAAEFRQQCKLWQIVNREASTRRLAALLKDGLEAQGAPLGIEHIQRSIAGKTPRVRNDLAALARELLRASLPEGESVESLTAKTEWSSPRSLDLAWVRCAPIAELAAAWLADHRGTSMRQLALRVVKTIRRMGYRSSHNTIQPILGGWKKRTRGYVFRAVLKQFPDRDEAIPPDAFVAPAWARAAAAPGRGPGPARERPGSERAPTRPKLTREAARGEDAQSQADAARGALERPPGDFEEFIDEATRHAASAKSPMFARLAALRAEKLFGVSAEHAYATILARTAS